MKEKQVVEYDVNEAHIAQVTDKYKDFVLVPEDVESRAVLMEGLKEHREIRLAIEKKRKANNEKANEYIKANNGEGKRLHALNDPGEQRLKGIRQVEDDRVKAIQEEEERKEQERIENRMTALVKYGKPIPFFDAAAMTAEEFDAALLLAKTDFEAEQARIAEEKAERQAETERLEKERIELDRQREEQAAAQKKIDDANRKIEEEKAALEAEKRAESERKDRAEFEKQARARAEQEAKEKAERAEKAAKEQVERDEHDRLERKRVEEEEKARQEAMKPDKEKLLAFADKIFAFAGGKLDVKSKEAQNIYRDALQALMVISDQIKNEAEAL